MGVTAVVKVPGFASGNYTHTHTTATKTTPACPPLRNKAGKIKFHQISTSYCCTKTFL